MRNPSVHDIINTDDQSAQDTHHEKQLQEGWLLSSVSHHTKELEVALLFYGLMTQYYTIIFMYVFKSHIKDDI